jgi:hypothetical protein
MMLCFFFSSSNSFAFAFVCCSVSHAIMSRYLEGSPDSANTVVASSGARVYVRNYDVCRKALNTLESSISVITYLQHFARMGVSMELVPEMWTFGEFAVVRVDCCCIKNVSKSNLFSFFSVLFFLLVTFFVQSY